MQFPLKTLIVEDSPKDLELLEIFLKKHPDKFKIELVVMTFQDAVAALANRFQLSIIDHNLDDRKVWYDVIDSVGIRNMGTIVLHTAKQRGSFERTQKARDYIFLKKPLNTIGFTKFIIELGERIKELPEIPKIYRYKILENKEHIFLKDEDIVFIESQGNYSIYHTTKRNVPYSTSKKLWETLEILNPSIFIRCSDQYIVNIECIQTIIKDNDSGGDITLPNDIKIQFTKTYRNNLIEKGFL